MLCRGETEKGTVKPDNYAYAEKNHTNDQWRVILVGAFAIAVYNEMGNASRVNISEHDAKYLAQLINNKLIDIERYHKSKSS